MKKAKTFLTPKKNFVKNRAVSISEKHKNPGKNLQGETSCFAFFYVHPAERSHLETTCRFAASVL